MIFRPAGDQFIGDELAAVVGVKAANHEGKLSQHGGYIGFAPLAARHRRGPRLGVVVEALALARVAAQVVQVSIGNRRQPLDRAGECAEWRGRSGFCGSHRPRQQLDVGS
jgi:hypothetical protein